MSESQMNLKFQIKGIELLDFEIARQSEPLPTQIVFHFNINVEQRLKQEEKLVFVIVGISIYKEDMQTQLGSIRVSNIFSIDNFDDFVESKEKGVFIISEEVTDILNSISISTTRGVMFAAFKGTVLHSAILPVVNPQDFKKEKLN